MIGTEPYTLIQVNQYDPTRTLTLRRSFERAMNRRFAALERVIRVSVDQNDAFGLKGPVQYQPEPASPGQFDYPRNSEKIEAFMEWLRRQEDRGVLQIAVAALLGLGLSQPWTNAFILEAYKRGVDRARTELRKAGYVVPTVEASGGVEAIIQATAHVDALTVAYTRSFEALKGITAQMDGQIAQILAEGLAQGDNPRRLGRKLVSVINGQGLGDLGITDSLGRVIPARRRAETLARTEIIRAHHLANVEEYKAWRAEGVTVIAEWSTAGDERVCSECAGMHGNRYSLEEIQHMIPRHPNCRCIAIPVEVKK